MTDVERADGGGEERDGELRVKSKAKREGEERREKGLNSKEIMDVR